MDLWKVHGIMKTAQSPDDHFQNAGEPCESCRMFWEHQGLPPMTMVQLCDGDEIVTTEGGIPIVICPRCDGDMILRLPKE